LYCWLEILKYLSGSSSSYGKIDVFRRLTQLDGEEKRDNQVGRRRQSAGSAMELSREMSDSPQMTWSPPVVVGCSPVRWSTGNPPPQEKE
jgi:hypothetical protein